MYCTFCPSFLSNISEKPDFLAKFRSWVSKHSISRFSTFGQRTSFLSWLDGGGLIVRWIWTRFLWLSILLMFYEVGEVSNWQSGSLITAPGTLEKLSYSFTVLFIFHDLAKFRSNKAEFLHSFITMNETWFHNFTFWKERPVKQRTEKEKVAPKKPKTVAPIGKIMASVFWDARWIIFIDYLEKWRTINGEYYANILQCLSEEIKQKRLHLAKKKVLFHQDNAPAHKSVIAIAKINELKYKLLPQFAGYFLTPNLKKMAQWLKIFQQWRSDVCSKLLFWGKRQFFL